MVRHSPWEAAPAQALTMVHVGVVIIAAALISAGLIVALRPMLVRYALARPNARSSHKTPTPQGGGMAVLASVWLVAGIGLSFLAAPEHSREVLVLGAASIALAAVGGVDDVWPLPALFRIVLQIVAVTTLVVSEDHRVLPGLIPLWLEQGLIVLAGVWFVNLVNFMDGIDWMTVAEVVPIAAFVALLGAAGLLPLWMALIGAALLGAMLGFAPSNKPVAKLFLGDVGSLPLGLLVGWMLLKLAAMGALAAALLLPLYYLADATITLLRRLRRREHVWEAHRQHFYQQAIDRNGYSVAAVVTYVFVLNLVLAGLAAVALLWPAWPVQSAAMAAGCALVGFVLRRFATPRAIPVTA